MLVGLLWPHLDLPAAWGVAAVVLIVYSAYANWLATLLAAVWGAGRRLAPIAAGDHEAPAAREGFVSFLLVSLSLSIVAGVGRVGHRHSRALTHRRMRDPARGHPGQRGARLSMKAWTPSSALGSIMLRAIVAPASS